MAMSFLGALNGMAGATIGIGICGKKKKLEKGTKKKKLPRGSQVMHRHIHTRAVGMSSAKPIWGTPASRRGSR